MVVVREARGSVGWQSVDLYSRQLLVRPVEL
jgi:hypothetical protein